MTLTDSPAALTRRARLAAMKRQQPCVLWLTGLSGAGKSTVALALQDQLTALGHHSALLDGDALRDGLCQDLGFGDAARSENIRRAAEVARLMTDAGLIVIAAFISPFRRDRDAARARMAPDEFAEVHIDTPLAVAEARDPKGLYKRARLGQLPQFTGIGSPYEAPLQPELRIDTTLQSPAQAAQGIIDWLHAHGRLSPAR
jgi:adenylyl-sulfate kinase